MKTFAPGAVISEKGRPHACKARINFYSWVLGCRSTARVQIIDGRTRGSRREVAFSILAIFCLFTETGTEDTLTRAGLINRKVLGGRSHRRVVAFAYSDHSLRATTLCRVRFNVRKGRSTDGQRSG